MAMNRMAMSRQVHRPTTFPTHAPVQTRFAANEPGKAMGTYYDSGRPHAPSRAAATRRASPVVVGAVLAALVAMAIAWHAGRDGRALTSPDAIASMDAGGGGMSALADPDGSGQAMDRAPRPLAGNPVPRYPRAALRNGSEGDVLLSILIGVDGRPMDVQVIGRSGSQDPAFDRAAIEAARQWRFEPAMRGGEAVPSTVHLPVEFRRG